MRQRTVLHSLIDPFRRRFWPGYPEHSWDERHG